MKLNPPEVGIAGPRHATLRAVAPDDQQRAAGSAPAGGAEDAAASAAGPGERGADPASAVARVRLRAPTRGNRRLDALLERASADGELRGWWHLAQVNSERLGMSDHSWVHVQIVVNIALRLLRLLVRGGIEPAMVADHAMHERDAEVVVAAGALLHDVGMSIHRTDHEAFSLFLAERKLRELLGSLYEDPERTVVIGEALHAIIGHRRRGEPYTLEGGVVRVADALDMAHGRSRVPVGSGVVGIHAVSAAAIDAVKIEPGADRPVRVEIEMNNSAGIFQVDDLLAQKLRGTPLEGQIEIVAAVEGDTEKRLIREFRL
jgi:metal-dependent HD superfamily phosphatase/phosphodiesterase